MSPFQYFPKGVSMSELSLESWIGSSTLFTPCIAGSSENISLEQKMVRKCLKVIFDAI